MPIIETEPVYGPPRQGLVVMIVVMAAAVLGLLLVAACGSAHPTKVSTAANGVTKSQACRFWQASGGTGELEQMSQGMTAILADIKAGDAQTLQVDGMAMSSITGMDVVTNAPPVMAGSWARMVLDLNKAGQELVGGDVISASGHLTLAKSYASDIKYALHRQCGF